MDAKKDEDEEDVMEEYVMEEEVMMKEMRRMRVMKRCSAVLQLGARERRQS